VDQLRQHDSGTVCHVSPSSASVLLRSVNITLMTVNVGHSEVTVLMTVHLSDFHNKGNSHSSLSSFVKFQEHVDCGSRQIILNVVKVQQCTFAGPAHCQNQAAAPHHPNRYGLNCPAGPPQCQDQAAARHHPTATV